MRQSELFTKTRREAPKDEESKNAKFLIRAGFVHKEMAGVYSYLPLGLRVLKKIERIIREEMNGIGGQEVILTTLQDPEVWKRSGRWSDEAVDVWFKSKFKSGSEAGIASTHEEPLANLLRSHIDSYRDLPVYIYQFQTKFRNELRAKSGILRAREFIMKDLYSFSRSEEEFREFYERCAGAYINIFRRVGIGGLTYRAFASGGSFSKYSDEFQTLCPAGEDTIYIDEKKKIAVNKEVYADEVLDELGLKRDELREEKSIEVGNIFPLGDRFSKALGLVYKDESGKECYPVMGSYGIGLGRLMGTVVEIFADERGLVWPRGLAPFQAHIVGVNDGSEKNADALYGRMLKRGIEVFYDDRKEASAGEKFADADLIGSSYRIVLSEKTRREGKIEVKERKSGEIKLLREDELFRLLEP